MTGVETLRELNSEFLKIQGRIRTEVVGDDIESMRPAQAAMIFGMALAEIQKAD
jgi:hypothetical protein